MTKDEVLMMALEALKANDLLINGTEKAGGLAWCIDGYYSDCFDIDPINEQTERAITAIKEALAQPQQKPKCGAIIEVFGKDWRLEYMSLPVGKHKLYTQQYTYTTPPQRTWVGLTDEEMTHTNHHMVEGAYQYSFKQGAKWAEAKLKEKNT